MVEAAAEFITYKNLILGVFDGQSLGGVNVTTPLCFTVSRNEPIPLRGSESQRLQILI